ncbi:hypothetical protein C9426_34065 [Serratia sp. S1B]|nr:hypothetical protein C9426_34065 [Serratia sp. S1B]
MIKLYQIITLIIAIILPTHWHTVDIMPPTLGKELRRLHVNEKNGKRPYPVVIYGKNGEQWTLNLEDVNQTDNYYDGPVYNNCLIEYQRSSIKTKRGNYSCYGDISSIISVDAYEIDDNAIIVELRSERGGTAFIFSINTTANINYTRIPYSTNDEDDIYFYKDNEKVKAISAYDNFTLLPDETNMYFIKKYEGEGLMINW